MHAIEPGNQRWRAQAVVYASLQFLVLTTAAMLIYPGGAVFQLDARRYLFLGNFFSDLGATVTPSGRTNLASHILFLIALGSVGVALILASPAWRPIAAARQKARGFGWAAQLFEVLAGIGFLGIAATPWDRVLDAHNAFVRAAFGLLLLYDLCLLVLEVANRWPRPYTIANAIYLIMLLVYVCILFKGPRLDTAEGLAFQVAAQKIIVYASIANLALQALSILKNPRRVSHPSAS